MNSKRSGKAQLDADERAAWREYLRETRKKEGARYRELEPWAWARLQARLKAITARRSKIAA